MIVILDGNSIAYRAYHKAPPLSAPDGTPTGTVHIFFTILERVRSQLKPSKIIAAFDAKGETTRHMMYPEYKANREAMPEDLAPQLEMIKSILPLAGVPVYCKTGIEADDIIATIAKQTDSKVTIVTKDKDLFQLVNDKIKIFDDQTGKLMGEEDAVVKYGVKPSQMLSYLSLIGDKSDNIPGVTGVGEKTASKLISEYNSLDGIYLNLDNFKGKLKENLERDKEKAYMAQSLIKLQDVELFEPVLSEDKEKLREVLSSLGMRMVASKLLSSPSDIEEKDEEVIIPQLPPCIMGEVKSPTYFLAIEDERLVTDGKHFESFKPEMHKIHKNASFYDVKEFIKFVKSDIESLGDVKDYMLISWLCEPDSGTVRKAKTEPMEEFIPRLLHISKGLDAKLKKLDLEKLYKELELKVAYILSKMEMLGIRIDPSRVRKIANVLKQQASVVASRLIQRAGYEINLNSPKQLAEYLYDNLGIKPLTKTKRSTAEDVLKELLIASPEYKDILEDILTYREYAKLISTYTQPLIDSIAEDGRVHTTFKQTGTGTGRLSSVSPNLQNIPARGDIGKTIRSAFIPAEGYEFVSADYSQIELRLLAHLSKDPMLIEAFNNNEDIHTITAMKIFHLKEDEVTADVRRLAKAVNFGIIYGLSPYGLSRDTGVTPKEAKEFIDNYFTHYSKVKGYISDTIAFTREHGYCETVLGRKRFFSDINSRNGLNRQRAERAAMNAPLQGGAADIIKLAMINCDRFISENKDIDARLCLQIHDELIFEVKKGDIERFVPQIKKEMENAFKLEVPLSVNIDHADSWGGL